MASTTTQRKQYAEVFLVIAILAVPLIVVIAALGFCNSALMMKAA